MQLPKKHNVHPGKKQPLATRLNTYEQAPLTTGFG
jgi:hypothetical protein